MAVLGLTCYAKEVTWPVPILRRHTTAEIEASEEKLRRWVCYVCVVVGKIILRFNQLRPCSIYFRQQATDCRLLFILKILILLTQDWVIRPVRIFRHWLCLPSSLGSHTLAIDPRLEAFEGCLQV